MTTIANRPSATITPPTSGQTTATNATTATTATTPTQTTTPVGNPNASGAGSVMQTTKLDGGYTSGSFDYDSYAVAGQNAGNNLYNSGSNTAGRIATGKEGYERGAISVSSAAVDAKHFALDVKTMHANPYSGKLKGNDDKLSLFIETKIQGKDKNGNPSEVIARLAMPLKGPANNVDAYNGAHRFVISYDELNAALKAHHPDLSLFDAKGNFVAGATIAVRAKWDNGHNWGGYGRLGVTDIPAPAKKQNATAVQAGNLASSTVKIAADEMPVDLEHQMPASVSGKYSKSFQAYTDSSYSQKTFDAIFNPAKPVKASTRLERELKGKVDSVEKQEAAIVRMQLISAGYEPLVRELRGALTAELVATAKMKPSEAKAFAAKLHVSPHAEWAQKDAGGAYIDSPRLSAYKKDPQKLVDTGLAPNLAEAQAMIAFIGQKGIVFHDPLPLEDVYKGTKSEMQASVIRRVRSNAIAEGVYNVKPGPGKLQSEVDSSTAGKPCGLIRARIEASIELKDKNVNREAITAYERSDGTPYNIIGQLLEDAGVYVAGNYSRYQEASNTDKTPVSFTMMQERHRFDIEVDGMKLDTSIDFVRVEDPPGSGNVATRQIVEMELEHKFIEQTPATPAGGAGQTATPAGGAAASTATPSLQNSFGDLAKQQKAASELSEVSLNVPPRFHRLSDLDDKELWATKEQLASNAVTNALISLIYPGGVSSCEQKGVEMARALGKI